MYIKLKKFIILSIWFEEKNHILRKYEVMNIYISESLISSLLDSEHKICLYHYECWLEERRQMSPALPVAYLLYFYQKSSSSRHEHAVTMWVLLASGRVVWEAEK